MTKSLQTLLSLVLFMRLTQAQIQAESQNMIPLFRKMSVNVAPRQTQLIALEQVATSVVFKAPFLGELRIVADLDTISLRQDAHAADSQSSQLIVFEKPLTQLQILSNDVAQRIKLHLFYVKPLASGYYRNAKVLGDCDKPTVVAGSTWRTGLTPPKEAPVSTQVKHIVVHHAAGSNTATNYVDVVRNIYIYHTQSNGWNDVGYNFLIAQDGTVFEGRMGSASTETDNVLGAHFCSKNTETMGICLLGDYMTAQPPNAMIESLKKLISWKLRKENLSAIGTSPHPTATSAALNNIVGHRDGCATDCPGDNVYKILGSIVTSLPPACAQKVLSIAEDEIEMKVYPQPARQSLTLRTRTETPTSITLTDMLGRTQTLTGYKTSSNEVSFDTAPVSRGIYLLKAGKYAQKIVLN